MYREFKGLNLPEIDREILRFWKDKDIFKKSIEQRPKDKSYVFYEGPPSANGQPGIHHVIARTIKDLFCRFHTMNGQRVERKGGWDTHGLPIELNVEKELNITKEDIGKKISIEDYNAACREMVMRYKDQWDDITEKMGYWVDLDHPYITFKNDYIESVWWLLKQLFDKNLLYKGYTVQPFSPAAGTGLSSHELNQPGTYQDVTDTTMVAQFKIVQNALSAALFQKTLTEELYFVAWTTTPWTLPSNTALAVGMKINYVLIATFNPYTHAPVNIILAEDLIDKWLKKEGADIALSDYTPGDKIIPYTVLGHFRGAEFEGISYEQLMPYAQPEEGDAFKVLLGDFVSTSEGTGIVHIAPSFGSDDMMVAKKYGIGALTLVDKRGRFVPEVTDYAGRYVKDYKDEGDDYINVDIDIAVQLKKENKAFNVQKHVHPYPHCWRTDKPILYYPLDSWFIKTTAYKERMVELNKTINWMPSHTGEKRFGNWLENLQDWNLSRSRYWGIPLPIWRTEDGEDALCIGSIEELAKAIKLANKKLNLNQDVPQDMHRPFIDEIILVSDEGLAMKRELDLIDVWFDSGSMPYAQWHFPFENKEEFKRKFPADFIAEGVDQTRGWFFTLHAIAVMVFDSVAFKNVVSNGLVQDKSGRKMSKRLGNAVEPFETLAKYGVDPTRWYMIANAQPWDNLKFDVNGIEEVKRKFFGTLYNTYSFYALYANVDGFVNKLSPIPHADRPELDRWILSMLHSLMKETFEAYDRYDPTTAARKIQSFVDLHLSNWYVRLSRRRFWKGDMSPDKISAYQTLNECLTTIAKLMAPIAPFFADWLYNNLNEISQGEEHDSVHLSYYPKADEAKIDADLEARMIYAQRISSLVLSLRKKDKLRVRQPLQKIMIPAINEQFVLQVKAIEPLIKTEVNIKEIELLSDDNNVIQKQIKPNFKTLGKRLGKHMKSASTVINTLTQDQINQIEKGDQYTLELEGESFELSPEDFVITSADIPGWSVANDNELTVALDITLTETLIAEGMARELINRIQNIRKNKAFDVTDRIEVSIQKDDKIVGAITDFGDYIMNEILADQLKMQDNLESDEVMDLPDGLQLAIIVTKTS